MESKSALVVIPTTGSSLLNDAIKSVINQTYSNVELWIVVDGPEFFASANSIIDQYVQHYKNIKVMHLPSNTGANGWYGHRVYAAVSYLFNHDYILYLDQDNWFEPTHVESMVNACEVNGWHWGHSLRKIFNADGSYVCDDDCESLGKWPIYLSNDHFLVDTSTYCIRKEVMIGLAPAWYSGWGGDRRFYSAISKHFPNFGCTGKSTSCYRLDGNSNSVNAEFFINGNSIMHTRYPWGFPWRK